jgi:hypothetical protein
MQVKKEEKEFIEWIEKQIRYYKPILGLNLQRIKAEKDSGTEYLSIGVTYPYLDPTVSFSEKALKDFTGGKIPKDRILHELCHAITDPLYCKSVSRYVSKNEIEDERERLTDKLTVIIRNLL